MTTPAENQNWQKRQYDSFGPHFRIETANPELGIAGNIAYNLYGYSDSKDVSNLGMMGDGQFQIFADQCITIAGGANVDGGGVCVNIIGTKGDVAISAERNGDEKIKGRNIFLDAEENIELTTGGKVDIDSNQQYAAQFGVRNIPTVLVFKDGELVDRKVGVSSKNDYAQAIDKLI